MRVVDSNELINYKVLPFDLFTKDRKKILSAGEVLTPGKLIMLKNYSKIFAEDFKSAKNTEQKIITSVNNPKSLNFSYETLDAQDFETILNKESCLTPENQTKIKYFFKKTLDLFKNEYFEEGLIKMQTLVNIINNDLYKHHLKHSKGSNVRFLGEYELCHPLNVASISGLIARKLEFSPRNIDEIMLSALLHDIGKLFMHIDDTLAILSTDEETLKDHPIIGYKFLKEKLKMSEKIAKAVLEHHENNDGSGYPKGLSNDYINEYSQIINVANYYDNLAFNRTHYLITNNREALRTMLEIGTSRFSAKMLYTFIHMFNYDDIKDFNEMMM